MYSWRVFDGAFCCDIDFCTLLDSCNSLLFLHKLEPESGNLQRTAVAIMPCANIDFLPKRHVVSCILVVQFSVCIWRLGPPKNHVPFFLKRERKFAQINRYVLYGTQIPFFLITGANDSVTSQTQECNSPEVTFFFVTNN